MRTILFMLQKEFLQVFRNKQMLPMIFLMPLFQLLILANAATFEIKDIKMVVVDDDRSQTSRNLINQFAGTNYFFIRGFYNSDNQAKEELAKNNARVILKIPEHFEKDIQNGSFPKIQLVINAEDGSAAGVIQAYSSQIIQSFNKSVLMDLFTVNPVNIQVPTLDIIERYWYNQELNYKEYMVPGLLAILVTIITLFLSSMNIVREREIGTIEQLNATPIRKRDFIAGKLLPFWFIGLFELAFGLLISVLVYQIPIRGNIFLIFALSGLYLTLILSFGLLISTITDTQQQAMFLAWFFAVIFILMSGLFTPIDSMPKWAQIITIFNPMSHFIEIMRRVILKGSGIVAVQRQVFILAVYSLVVMLLAIWRYRKVSA